ncbi:hypothetical protein PG984_007190 [Apiospora sp. TS-2023a]
MKSPGLLGLRSATSSAQKGSQVSVVGLRAEGRADNTKTGRVLIAQSIRIGSRDEDKERNRRCAAPTPWALGQMGRDDGLHPDVNQTGNGYTNC